MRPDEVCWEEGVVEGGRELVSRRGAWREKEAGWVGAWEWCPAKATGAKD